MNIEGYKRLSLLFEPGQSRGGEGRARSDLQGLAEYTEDILVIVLPPRKIEDPAFHESLRQLAGLYPGRRYLAGTMLFRGNDAARLASLDTSRRKLACAWSPPTTCTTTCPNGGRCTTLSPHSA